MEGKMVILSKKKGEIVFRQGDEEKALYKVVSGKIIVYRDYEGTNPIRLATFGTGQCFGEMSLLENQPRSATAVVEEDAMLAVYHENVITTFIYQNPTFAFDMMKELSARLRKSTVEMEKMHRMMLKMAEEKKAGADVNDYLHLHTTYAADGTPRFHLFP